MVNILGDDWLSRARESLKHQVERPTTWCVTAIICAGILAWGSRFQINPDGLSYLDLGRRAVAHGPAELINGYWSPLYPALIALALAIVRPSLPSAIPLIHVLNFIIFLFTLATFGAFVSTFLGWNRSVKKHKKLLEVPFVATGFLCLTFRYLGPDLVTPDLLVAGILFHAFRSVWTLTPTSSSGRYARLGLALGVGYYAKTSMFVLAAILLFLLAFTVSRKRVRGTGVAYSVVAFLATSAPLAALISAHVGHRSIGEAARLNYIWYVDYRELTRNEGWFGLFPNTPSLSHAPRVIAKHPLALEFAAPIPGTFPIWYAPEYWWRGVKPDFKLTAQFLAIRDALSNYAAMSPALSPWCLGLVGLWLFGPRYKMARHWNRFRAWPVLWSVSALTMFALVHVEGRFVVPVFALVFLYAYRLLSRRVQLPAASPIVTALITLALFMISGQVALAAYHGVRQVMRQRQEDYVLVGRELQAKLQPGDGVGVVGHEFQAFQAYYAWYSGTRVIVRFPDPAAFWRSSAVERDAVLRALAVMGVRAIVAQEPPPSARLDGWLEIRTPRSRFVVLMLPQPPSAG